MKEICDWASVGPFDSVVKEVFGPVDVTDVLCKLQAGDGILVGALETLGRTQEDVLQVLQQLIGNGIQVYVIQAPGPAKITPATLAFLEAFQQLDVTLIRRAA